MSYRLRICLSGSLLQIIPLNGASHASEALEVHGGETCFKPGHSSKISLIAVSSPLDSAVDPSNIIISNNNTMDLIYQEVIGDVNSSSLRE